MNYWFWEFCCRHFFTRFLCVDDSITASSGGTLSCTKRDNSDGTIDQVYLQLIDGDILSTDTLTNNTQDLTGLTINTLGNPEFDAHSGVLLYYDNRKPITRDSDQVETVKMILLLGKEMRLT